MTWREKKVRGEQVAPNAAEFIDGTTFSLLIGNNNEIWSPKMI